MNLQHELAASQREVLAGIIAREFLIAGLYDQFADTFHEHHFLWTELAHDERKHAEALHGMVAYIDRGVPLCHLGELQKNRAVDEVKESIGKLREGELRSNDALITAMRLECQVIAQFFDKVYVDDPEFEEVSKRVRAVEDDHKNRIKHALLTNI